MMHSLRGRLFVGLTVLIVATALGAGVLAFNWAFDEAIELQDSILIQIGAIAGNVHFANNPTAGGDVDAEARVVIEEIDDAPDSESLRILPDGLHLVSRAQQAWRLLIRTRSDGSRVVIGQPTAIRDEIARDSALRTVLPLAALVPCLMLVIAIVIRQTLRPMSLLAARLDARAADDLEMLPLEGTPAELHPFIASINRLLARMQTMIAQQRRFIADAAHELRTPITALSLQAENLDHVELPSEGRDRLAALKNGAHRTAHLLEQLLALARYDMGRVPDAPVTSLDRSTKEVVADLLPKAVDCGIDLGFELVEPVLVKGDPVMLATMIRNLVDNALRHTPEGGRIDIGVYRDDGRAILQIEDTGTGIPEADLKRIFEPFVRGSRSADDGTGLGLSIVKRIVERLSGSVTLENVVAPDHSGLRVIVSIPLVSCDASAPG
jgi:two-component system OmpR family sensor kinase